MFADGIIRHDLDLAERGAWVVAGLTGANRLLDWASVTIRMRLREHSILHLDEEVIELAARAPSLEHHERPEYQDRLALLREDRVYLVNPFMPVAWLLAAVVQLVATVAVLASLHPVLALLPLSGVPALLFSLRSDRSWEQARDDTVPGTRLGLHLMELSTRPAAAKEIRVFDLADELADRYTRLMRDVERHHMAVDASRTAGLAAGWAVFAAGFMAAVAFVIGQVLEQSLSVGAVALTLSLGAQINSQLSELVDNTSWVSRTAHAVGRYRWLMESVQREEAALEPTEPASAPDRLRSGITFDDVSFTYPGTSTDVLANVDLHLPAGSTVAVVGANGAGKTTLVKLLLRLYEPTAGHITVDDVKLAQIDVDNWRARTSATFQDFAQIQLAVGQSIGLGSLPAIDHEPTITRAIERAAATDLHDKLPNGLTTVLGNVFDNGVELSTGQWQKVAIARSMMRSAPLLLALDEPTASLDAPTEHRLFDSFTGTARHAARASGAITLLVSHRLSTVRAADLIVVVADNRVAETGSHDELIEQRGVYAELYELQASGYR
jgi:ATP-binding cassette subfamily B protein